MMLPPLSRNWISRKKSAIRAKAPSVLTMQYGGALDAKTGKQKRNQLGPPLLCR